jgi:Ca2+-binding RTX toxin-like protein
MGGFMAGYVFEIMTQSDAAQFRAEDTLTFSTGSASQVRAVQTGGSTSGGQFSGIALTLGSRTLTFPSLSLSQSSIGGRVNFSDNSRLLLGTGGADTIAGGDSRMDAIFGFEGNDILGNQTMSTSRSDAGDYFHGGIGADTIVGTGGNDHIWGNSISNDRPEGVTMVRTRSSAVWVATTSRATRATTRSMAARTATGSSVVRAMTS